MSEERCTVCGDKSSGAGIRRGSYELTRGISVTINETCEHHCEVLLKAFGLIVKALKQGSEEQRERVLDRLYERLNQNGFELTAPEPSVVPPLYEKWRRHV